MGGVIGNSILITHGERENELCIPFTQESLEIDIQVLNLRREDKGYGYKKGNYVRIGSTTNYGSNVLYYSV